MFNVLDDTVEIEFQATYENRTWFRTTKPSTAYFDMNDMNVKPSISIYVGDSDEPISEVTWETVRVLLAAQKNALAQDLIAQSYPNLTTSQAWSLMLLLQYIGNIMESWQDD